MARAPRNSSPGTVHDVTAGGIRRLPIVLDDHDRLHWLALLARVTERFGWLVHAYCLLDNRFRLLVETPVANLSSGMQRLNGLHAQGFNSRHGLTGHLFDGRYRSEPVDKDSSLLGVCREVVLEPVRAGVCLSPEDYRWSSYRGTIGLEAAAPFLRTAEVLDRFGRPPDAAPEAFRRFVEDGLPREGPDSAATPARVAPGLQQGVGRYLYEYSILPSAVSSRAIVR